jgi:hypothetical protein
MNKVIKKKLIDFEEGIDVNSIGYKIDRLIRSNLKNWEGKEVFFDTQISITVGNKYMYQSFQANKVRNKMITEINAVIHGGLVFHFRNYHNY